ncbi:MAG: MFS transporter [Deltaproteobacteria bacterium]|nr:MFS transporter [Deltaproteobacteria bacterium]
MERIPILLIFLAHLWVDASQGILPVALALLRETFSLSYLQVGLATSILNFTSSVIQPLFGLVADRFRLGWFIPFGLMWTALSMGLLGWAPNYPALLLLVGMTGIGTAAFHPRAMMAVSLLSGARKGLGTAVFSTGGNLGFALGPVVGTFLILGIGLHATAWLILPGLVITLALWLYPGDFLQRKAPARSKTSAGEGGAGAHLPWFPITLVCLIVTLRSWVYMTFLTYLPIFLQGQGIELKRAGLLLTAFLAGGAAAGLYGGHLSDRIGRKKIIIVSKLVYPLFASLMILSGEPWIWVFAVLSGATLLCSFSVTVVLAQELMPQYLGLASGLILGLGFGTGGLGVAVSGWMADGIGLYQTMWILAFIPILCSLLAALVKMPRQTAGR